MHICCDLFKGAVPTVRLRSHLQVQPVLQRLKTTLTSSGAALLMSSVLLFGLIRAGSDADGMYGEQLHIRWLPQACTPPRHSISSAQCWRRVRNLVTYRHVHPNTTALVTFVVTCLLILLAKSAMLAK